jgi:hypothetical protein
MPRFLACAFALLTGPAAGLAHGQTSSLAAAVLPGSRSVQVHQRATVFATLINTGQAMATGCQPVAVTPLPIAFTYQAADRGTNQPVGSPALPVDIPAGAAQAFVLTITATEAFAPTNLQIDFACDNAGPAPAYLGVNSLLISAEHQPTPDIVAMALTASGDGALTLNGGLGSFAVATVNLGSPGQIAVSADTGTPALPLTATVCQTRPESGECVTPPAPLISITIGSSDTPTFGVFAQTSSEIRDNPTGNRIHVRFVDSTGAPRGATSVSVRSAAGASDGGDPSPASPRVIAGGTWMPIAMDRPGFYASWQIGGKHGRCAFNSASGWIYCMGGDWYSFNDPAEQGDGNNEIWAYNVATNEWRKEYPPGDSPCAPAGDIVPPQPDESTWVYDSRRNVFHLMPGFWFGTAAYHRSCTAATTHWGHLIYDPAAKRYAVGHFQAPAAGWGGDLRAKSGIYDPVRDEVVRFDSGPAVQRWNVGTGALTEEPLPLEGAFVEQDPMAFDPQGRTVYGIDYSGKRLVRYHLDTKQQVNAWPLPANYAWSCPGDECFDGNNGNVTFDEARRVLVLPNMPSKFGLIQHLYTFDVAAESWQEIPLLQTAGATINGNTMVYDPANGVHLLIGGRVTPHFFLFRLAGP